MKSLILALAVITLMGAGCGTERTDEDAASDTHSPKAHAGTTKGHFASEGITAELSAEGVTVAGVTFYPPTDWQDLGVTEMRKAQYSWGPVDGDEAAATMVVYYFGADQGGAVQANIDRWIGQMSQPDGSDPKEAAMMKQFEVDGMAAHVVELTGAYSGSMGMGGGDPLEGYRMAAVVLEGPEGSLFFKLTGPDNTAAGMAGPFAVMIDGVKKAK